VLADPYVAMLKLEEKHCCLVGRGLSSVHGDGWCGGLGAEWSAQ